MISFTKGCDIPQNVVCKTYHYEFLTFPSLENSTTIALTSTSLVSSTKPASITNSTTSKTTSNNVTSSVTSKNSTKTSTYFSQTILETTTNELTTLNETKQTLFATTQTSLYLTELFTNNNISNMTTYLLRETTNAYSNVTSSSIFNKTDLFNTSDNFNLTTLDYDSTTKSSSLSETTTQYNLTQIFNLTTSLNLVSSTLNHSNSTYFVSFNSTDYSNETSPTYDHHHHQTTLIETTNSVNPFANNYTNLRSNVTLPQTSTTHSAELQLQANCTTRSKNVPNIYFRENGFYLANGTSDTNGQKNIYRKKLTKDYVYEDLKYLLRGIFIPQQFNDRANKNSKNHRQEDNS